MSTLFRRAGATPRAAALLLGSASFFIVPLTAAANAAPKAGQPAAASGPGYAATLAKSGEVTVREGEKTETTLTLRPGLFEPGWQYRTSAFDKASGAARIRATGAGSTVTVKPAVTVQGSVMTITCAFTADKDTPLNSLHLSLNIAAAPYVGGKAATVNGAPASVAIPPTPGETRLISVSSGGSLTITRKDGTGRVRVIGTNPTTSVMLQDGRVFGSSELEIRAGLINEHVLKAGTTETVAFTVELPQSIRLEEETPLTITAGPDWIPLAPTSLAIVPGSALDFSGFFKDGPAGKYGWVTARPDGHFGFEKRDKPQRFYGTNLCFSANYLTHAESDLFAERVSQLGYNSIRLHHFEGDLIDKSVPNSVTLRRDQMDKLDYLMAALKKRGIYVTTDLFVSRPVKPEEMGLDEGGMDDFKDAVLVSRPAMENWKAFSRNFLTHVNPYTKLAYKDEPALAFICVINEPNLTNGRVGAWKGKLRDLFAAEWKAWRTKRYPGDAEKAAAPLPASIDNNAIGRDLTAFFADLHQRGYDEMKSFLRREIGTKALLTYLNGWSETPAFMDVRRSFDYVDNHFYWDHPTFLEGAWGLPSTGASGNGSAVAAGGAGPTNLSMTRLFGKPFTVTEWDYAAPNRYRAESGLLMGTAAAIQDWDAIWHFAYSHGHDGVVSPRPMDYFNVVQDPLRQAAERSGILLFLRGDAKSAKAMTAATVHGASLRTPGPALPTLPNYRDLTLVRRVGVSLTDKGAPVPSPAPSAPPSRQRKSETGELLLNGDAQVLTVSTPRTAGVVTPVDKAVTSGPITVTARDARAVIAASSLDGKNLTESSRVLLTHLTDLQNSGARFSAKDRRIIESWGNLPYLVRRGSATVQLKNTNASKLKAWRLDTTGKRIAAVPLKVTGGTATLDLSTAAPDGSATLYYEIGSK